MEKMKRIHKCDGCVYKNCHGWQVYTCYHVTEVQAKAIAVLLSQSIAMESFAMLYDARVEIDKLKEVAGCQSQ